MDKRRSYLDSLNEGRRRKPLASLDEISRTLDQLESRLDRGKRQPAARFGDDDGVDEISRRMQRLAEGAGARRDPRGETAPAPRAAPPVQPTARREERRYDDLAHTIERSRRQEDGAAEVARIVQEIRELRDDFHQQMGAGLAREFRTLREELGRTVSTPSPLEAELGREIEKLARAIDGLGAGHDDHDVKMLRLELENLKGEMALIAREETVQGFAERWDAFEGRWGAIAERLDAFDGNSSAFEALEGRLDEITRAIAAVPRERHFDPEPFDRIEARITGLARALEEMVEAQDDSALVERLGQLSARMADVAEQAALPDERLDGLAAQLNAIATRLDDRRGFVDEETLLEGVDHRLQALAGELQRRLERPDPAAANAELLAGFDRRLEALSHELQRRLEQPDPAAANAELLEGFERRLETLSQELQRRLEQPDPAAANAELMEGFDRRLEMLARDLERRLEPPSPAAANAELLDAVEARIAALSVRMESQHGVPPIDETVVRGLEARLEDISARLGERREDVVTFDPELIRSLEEQLAGLSRRLADPGAALPELGDVSDRLERMEQAIAVNRDAVLEAARAAAEDAVRHSGLEGADREAAMALADDLKSLEALARRSDERNARTFEAIHDTLLKIVDRLGSLEQTTVAARANVDVAQPAPPKRAVAEAPPLAPEVEAPALARKFREPLSPTEAASQAAFAALGEDRTARGAPEEAAPKRSLLGGLARVLTGRGKSTEEAPVAETGAEFAAEADHALDAPLDPELANQPLEPGSGAPDLNAIMRRVRDERGQKEGTDSRDASKADFIAAARRAAQAAAAEADMLKKGGSVERTLPKGKFRFGSLTRSKSKPILMAAGAIVIALAGLQLGKAFMSSPQVAQSDPAPQVVAEAAETFGEDEDLDALIAEADDDTWEDEAAVEPATPSVRQAMQTPVRADSSDPVTNSAPPRAAPAVEPAATEQITIPTIPDSAGPLPLREAAASGDAKALFEIGARYSEGRGVNADNAEAARWYTLSAELGFAPAQYRIGNFLEKGVGVGRDLAKAKNWYQLAAAQGNASAMHNLAVLFAMGTDGVSDNESAARWFLEAAELGVRDSQFNMGILAAKGVGMPQNLEESYKWFALVAKGGDKDAVGKRDEVANAMTPEQLERARANAELWRARQIKPEANQVEIPDEWQEADERTASIDMSQAIRNIQLILNKNGYDAGTADGVMGARTKSAISRFQSDNGLEANGKIDAQLVQLLLDRR